MERDKRKPVVGETLFMKNTGNAARRQPVKLIPATVKTVGRKFFTVEGGHQPGYSDRMKFHNSTWRQVTNYTVDYMFYETEQEFLDETEFAEHWNVLQRVFGAYGQANRRTVTLDNLRLARMLIAPDPEA